MAIHYRTQGFILKKEDSREADRIFTVFTKDFGKLELLAKAERKIKSKLRAGLEVFYLSELEFIQGKTYKTLTDTSLIESYEDLRKDLKKLAIAYRVAEVTDTLIKGEGSEGEIWQLLEETFVKLNHSELRIIHFSLIYYYFLWNLLSVLGYEPELNFCVTCRKKLTPKKLYFNLEDGGVMCDACFRKNRDRSIFLISPEIIKLLRILLKGDWQILSRIKIAPSYQKSLEDISDKYYSYILSRY